MIDWDIYIRETKTKTLKHIFTEAKHNYVMNNVKIEELKREELSEALEVLNEAAKSYKKVLPPEVYKEPQMSFLQKLEE